MKLAVSDIGGTKGKYGYFEHNYLKEISGFNTPKSFENLVAEVHARIDSLAIEGIAVSAPGAVDEKSGIIRGISAVPYIHQRPIIKELEAEFQLLITIENEANCARICEVNVGAGKNLTMLLL